MLTDSATARQMGVCNAKILSIGIVDPLAGTLKNSWRKQKKDWEKGQLRFESPNEAVNSLRANPMLLRNVKELCRLQATLLEVVAELVQAKKKKGWRPSEAKQRVRSAEFKYFCDRWDSLR